MLNGWFRYALAERVWRSDGPAIQATARHVPALERLRSEVCAMVSLRHTALRVARPWFSFGSHR